MILRSLGAIVTLVVLGTVLWACTPDLPRARLEADYLETPDDMVTLAGTRLHVRVSGRNDAPAVILIHGFGSSLQTWDGWVAGLQATHRVVRFDLPGAGLSPPDSSGDYTDARAMALLVALMDHLGLARADLVGNSIGGRIAFSFAALHPERVRRLVLVSPDGFASPGFAYGVAPSVPATLQLMRWFLPRTLLRANLAAAYANPAALTEAVVTRTYDLIRAPGARAALLDRMRQTVLVDPRPLLARISAPVLLVWGEKDAMIPVTNAADYRAALADSQLIRLPDLGHVPQEEAPARSLVPVQEFLAP